MYLDKLQKLICLQILPFIYSVEIILILDFLDFDQPNEFNQCPFSINLLQEILVTTWFNINSSIFFLLYIVQLLRNFTEVVGCCALVA